MTEAAPGTGRQRGFTLVELLVVFTLLGLMFVALFGGLHFGARVWEAGAKSSEVFAEIELAQSLLRRQLDQLVPLTGPDEEITFAGEAERLKFTAPAPSQFGLQGFYRFDVFTETEGDGQALVLRWNLYRPDRTAADEDDSEQRTLLENVETLAFAYYGDPEQNERPQWQDRWVDNEAPPELIAIRVEFAEQDKRYWPELVIAPRLATGFLPQ